MSYDEFKQAVRLLLVVVLGSGAVSIAALAIWVIFTLLSKVK